jgi:hypothetical protein
VHARVLSPRVLRDPAPPALCRKWGRGGDGLPVMSNGKDLR